LASSPGLANDRAILNLIYPIGRFFSPPLQGRDFVASHPGFVFSERQTPSAGSRRIDAGF
jgi:hypothetical protein